jgi:thiol:disulfide interchange protein DsbD
VNWSFRVNAISVDTLEIIAKAKINEGWHTYSVVPSDNGPLPTKFYIDSVGCHSKIIEIKESNAFDSFSEIFGARVRQFDKEAAFTIYVLRKTQNEFSLKVGVEYMICNNVSCFPPVTEYYTIIVPDFKSKTNN